MAPEVLQGDYSKYYNNSKSVVYSFAIIIYQILTDSYPYPKLKQQKLTLPQLYQKIINNNYRPKLKKISNKKLRKLIKNCLATTPEDRPSLNEIYEILSNFDKKNK